MDPRVIDIVENPTRVLMFGIFLGCFGTNWQHYTNNKGTRKKLSGVNAGGKRVKSPVFLSAIIRFDSRTG